MQFSASLKPSLAQFFIEGNLSTKVFKTRTAIGSYEILIFSLARLSGLISNAFQIKISKCARSLILFPVAGSVAKSL